MRLKLYEIKKITASPIIYVLLIAFIAINIKVIAGNTYYRNDMKVLNSITDRFGYKINDSMLVNFKSYYSGELGKMNALAKERTSKTYKTAYDFLEDSDNYKTSLYSQKELDDIKRLNIIENYYSIAVGIDAKYGKIDIKDMGDEQIKTYGLSGAAAATVRGEYESLAIRFAQLKANGEEKALFFIGQIYAMHSFLFATVFRSMIFEIMILSVLIASHFANFEFENKTQALAYSTKRGRKLIYDKLFASILVCLGVTTVLIGVTLAVYFSVFDYSHVLNIPISSAFMQEANRSYISWWNMSFIQYLFAVIAIVYVCEIIFMSIAFCIATIIKNNYIVFAVFALILCASYMLPSLMPRNSNIIFATSFSPFILVLNPQLLFMEKGAFSTFKYYEVITDCVWAALMAYLCAFCTKRFQKSDIC
jgi:hypothetical protein